MQHLCSCKESNRDAAFRATWLCIAQGNDPCSSPCPVGFQSITSRWLTLPQSFRISASLAASGYTNPMLNLMPCPDKAPKPHRRLKCRCCEARLILHLLEPGAAWPGKPLDGSFQMLCQRRTGPARTLVLQHAVETAGEASVPRLFTNLLIHGKGVSRFCDPCVCQHAVFSQQVRIGKL